MIQIRIDVDYPFPGRWKSFVYTFTGGKVLYDRGDYLLNSKIIARMINQSSEVEKAYWFFTHKTLPDKEMLELLENKKHEIGLHVVKNPMKECKKLVDRTKKFPVYYNYHGIKRFLAKIIWKSRNKHPEIKFATFKGLRLFTARTTPTCSVERIAYEMREKGSTEEEIFLCVEDQVVDKGEVFHIHPDWLFEDGTWNHRVHYYNILFKLLQLKRDDILL